MNLRGQPTASSAAGARVEGPNWVPKCGPHLGAGKRRSNWSRQMDPNSGPQTRLPDSRGSVFSAHFWVQISEPLLGPNSAGERFLRQSLLSRAATGSRNLVRQCLFWAAVSRTFCFLAALCFGRGFRQSASGSPPLVRDSSHGNGELTDLASNRSDF